jgi:ferric-dicitrate binding protein FerR (iron transport regulator)
MMQDDLKHLLEKYLAEELSASEFERLWHALQEPANRKVWKSFMQEVWNNPQYENLADDVTKYEVLNRIRPMLSNISVEEGEEPEPRRRSIRRYIWWAAAACLVLAAGLLLLPGRKQSPDNTIVQHPASQEVLPGGNKAVLTLGDGSQITLDSASNGMLSQQGNAKVMKLANGQLAYNISDDHAAGIMYNTVRTPRGGQYRILLPDGTDVWLNAASSITYPTAFTGEERKVKVTGEVYFEVAAMQQASRKVPFIVDITSAAGQKKGEVEVLGTHFNINAYDDEAAVKTTLLEGAVKIRKDGAAAVTLQPGQQATLHAPIKVVNDIDLSQVIAWKDGYFKFTQADVGSMMRQAERWYDIKVEYPNGIPPDLFSGTLPRSVNLSQFLEILVYSDVNAKIDQRVVTINP